MTIFVVHTPAFFLFHVRLLCWDTAAKSPQLFYQD
jgi:hypothetical protein